MKYFRIANLFSLGMLFCITSMYAQAPVHLSSITQNLSTPIRVTIDNSDAIYVTDATTKQIAKYNAAGNPLGTIIPGGSPISIALNAANEIFYGDAESGKIFKVNSNGTTTVIYSGTAFPSSMIFVSDTLYVVDSKLKQVIVLTQSGNLIKTIGSGTLIYPVGIAYNPRNNRILISEHGGLGSPVVAKIWMFGLSGNLITSFGQSGNGDGKFYRIQGINVDRCGFIYAPDPVQGDVTVFDENGNFITKFGVWGDALGQLNIPLDIKINSNDEVLVTSMNNGALEIYKIFPKLTKIASDNVCQGSTYTFGNQSLTSAGTYTETFIATNGCDSVVTLTLAVVPAPSLTTTIVAPLCGDNNGSITAIPSGGIPPFVYSWNTNPPQYTATATGITGLPTETITVLVTDSNGCTVSSTNIVDCINSVVELHGETSFNFYPNPNHGKFTFAINSSSLNESYSIEIYNKLGEKVYENSLDGETDVNLTSQPKGIYFMKVSSNNIIIKTEKLIIN